MTTQFTKKCVVERNDHEMKKKNHWKWKRWWTETKTRSEINNKKRILTDTVKKDEHKLKKQIIKSENDNEQWQRLNLKK